MTRYKVNHIYETIQGEGALTGVPMVMVRLQGCPVGCPFCDTKETWEADDAYLQPRLEDAMGVDARWYDAKPGEIVEKVRALGRDIKWALVSGGEPMLQNCDELTQALRTAGYHTAVETSGTAKMSGKWSWVTVSPKIGMPGGLSIVPATIAAASEIKWVVGKQEHIESLCRFLSHEMHQATCAISLQPLSQNAKATALCVDACLRYGWRLSLQTHKFVGLK